MVDDRLLKRGHADAIQRGTLVKQIREAATDRLVFLVGNTAKEIGFEIRSLQEFMAAEHCFDGSESCVQETIRAIAPHPYWRNVFLFAAGRIFFEKESLIDSLIVVCERLNETLTDQAQGFITAGSRLALSMLKDGVARNQPENSQVLARCAARLLDAQDSGEATGLVGLFKSETSDVWEEELSKRLRDTRAKFSHLPWRLCIELVGANNEWADQLMRTQFPWRHAEVTTFLAETIEDIRLASNSFLDLLKEHVFFLSPTIWVRLLWTGKLPEALNWEPLRELASLYSRSPATNSSVLIDETGQQTCNGLRHQGSDVIKKWAALKIPTSDMGKMHSTWRTYHAVSEFAREFSPSGLAKQFSIMAETDPLLETESVTHMFPWQIHACLATKKSGMSMSQIISAVASGALGNAEDWARWDTLSGKGIKISALGFPSGVLSVSDDHRGAIYENAGWSHSGRGSRRNFEFAAALANALPRLQPDSKISKGLVNLCCFGLNSADPEWSPNDAVTVKRLVMCCHDMNIPMTREIVVAVVRSSLGTQAKIELLAFIGIGMDIRSWLHTWDMHVATVNASCGQIVAAMGKSDSWLGVLGPLSFLPPLPFIKALPASALEECRRHDESHRQAAIALQTNGLEWDKKGEEVAADVLSLRARYPHHLGELLEFIDSQGTSGAHLESFLLALMQVPASELGSHFQAKIASLLVKLVERRPAIDSLPDPSTPKPSNGEIS